VRDGTNRRHIIISPTALSLGKTHHTQHLPRHTLLNILLNHTTIRHITARDLSQTKRARLSRVLVSGAVRCPESVSNATRIQTETTYIANSHTAGCQTVTLRIVGPLHTSSVLLHHTHDQDTYRGVVSSRHSFGTVFTSSHTFSVEHACK
jgi:hypothetical protein